MRGLAKAAFGYGMSHPVNYFRLAREPQHFALPKEDSRGNLRLVRVSF